MSTFPHGRPPALAGEAGTPAQRGRRSDLSRAQARVGYLFVMPSFVRLRVATWQDTQGMSGLRNRHLPTIHGVRCPTTA